MKVYVTGASGKLGRSVMRTIPQAIIVNLRDENLDILNLRKMLSKATHVIHLAGSLKFDDKEELWRANYGLTKKLVDALPKNARIIYASSISVYGKKLAKLPADENTLCQPDSEYAKSKYAAEKEIARHKDHVILRIGPIYGPEFEDYFRMIDILRKGRMKIIGNGKNHVPFVHVDDVALAIKNALNAKKADAGIYILSGNSITQENAFRIVCKELGIETPKKRINKHTAFVLLAITKPIRKLLGKGEFLTKEHLGILANDRVFNCAKAKKLLGFKPRKTEDGIKEMVKLYMKKRKT